MRRLLASKIEEIIFAKDINKTKQKIDSQKGSFPGVSVNGTSIEIKGVKIVGRVDLSSIKCKYKLVLNNCTFTCHFDMSGAHFQKSVDLSNCIFLENINIQGSQIDGNLILSGIKVTAGRPQLGIDELWSHEDLTKGAANLELVFVKGNLIACSERNNYRTICLGTINLLSSKILGKLDLSGIQVFGDLLVQGANIKGNLFCSSTNSYRTEISGIANFVDIEAGLVDFSGSKFSKSLLMEGARINCGLQLKPSIVKDTVYPTEIKEVAKFLNIRVTGQVDFSGTKFENDVIMEGARIQGGFEFTPEDCKGKILFTKFFGDVNFSVIYVSGGADFSGAKFKKGFSLENATIKRGLRFGSYPINQLNKNRFCRTYIGKKANLFGIKVSGININGVYIKKNLNLKESEIRGDFNSDKVSTKIIAKIGNSLKLDGAKVFGNVDLRNAQIHENISLENAEIKGKFRLFIDNVYGCANFQMCSIRRIKITIGSIEKPKNKEKKNTIKKWVEKKDSFLNSTSSCIDMNIFELYIYILDSYLQCIEIIVSYLSGCVDRIDIYKTIFNYFQFTPSEESKINYKLNLSLANFEELIVSKAIIEVYREKINLEGFKFQKLSILPDNHTNTKPSNSYVALLEAAKPFPDDAYLFVEKYLRNQGAEVDANSVYLAMRRRDRRELISEEAKAYSLFQKHLKKIRNLFEFVLFDITTNYGTNYWRVLRHILAVLILTIFLFLTPCSVESHMSITASDVIDHTNDEIQNALSHRPHPSPEDWLFSDVFFESMQIVFPIFSIPSAEKWEPSSISILASLRERFNNTVQKNCSKKTNYDTEDNLKWSFESYASMISLISWLSVPGLLAGIPGINRGEQKRE